MATLDIVEERLHNQHLAGTPLKTPEDVVAWLGAVQSQDYMGAKWALSQRTTKATSDDIDALFNAGKILRTHVLRPTWHFVSPADIRWMLALTAPRVLAVSAYYLRKFGLDSALLKKSETLLASALKGKQLTRTELAQVLKDSGVTASGLQLGYILMNAELKALICSGAMRGKQHTYALLDERVPKTKPLNRDKALTELAKRYFLSRGPAQLKDFSWWSGLTITDAKTAVRTAKLQLHDIGGTEYWSGPAHSVKQPLPTIHLLPNYDEYLIAYKDRSAYATQFNRPAPADIFYRHILVVQGRVAGAWRETLSKKSVTITVTPLIALGKPEQAALKTAAERYGQFVGLSTELKL